MYDNHIISRNDQAHTDDVRNEPDYEKMERPGSAGEKRKNIKKEAPVYSGYSDTELDKEDFVLAPLDLRMLQLA